jgi:NADH:ubiquinone oxidoreductase subunit E
MLKRFAEVIGESAPADHVSLVGSFCMERCGKGMNWRFDDEDLSSASVEEAAEELRKRLSALAGGGT